MQLLTVIVRYGVVLLQLVVLNATFRISLPVVTGKGFFATAKHASDTKNEKKLFHVVNLESKTIKKWQLL